MIRAGDFKPIIWAALASLALSPSESQDAPYSPGTAGSFPGFPMGAQDTGTQLTNPPYPPSAPSMPSFAAGTDMAGDTRPDPTPDYLTEPRGSEDTGPPGFAGATDTALDRSPSTAGAPRNAAAARGGTNPQVAGSTTAVAGAGGGEAESALQRLTEFRGRYRKTVDGRLCAAAFVHEAQTYTDCTDARSPDGTTGREWCYVEVQLLGKGPKDWEFCAPSLNYNALRAFVRKEFDALIATNDEMVESLDVEHRRLQDMLSRFQRTCGPSHTALKETIGHVENRLTRGSQCLKRLEASLKEVGLIESAIEDVRTDIDREGVQSLKDPQNCLVVPGYEDDPAPDGLRGAYFANDGFRGPAIKYRNDRKIDFLFFGDGPIEDVQAHAYSIRWDGFILAPHSGPYVFTTETDCGVRVFLNKRPVIVDRMPPATEEDAFESKPIPLVPTEGRAPGIHRQDAPKVDLTAGEKYRIRIELVHSNHLKYKSPDTAVLRLLWRSGAAEPAVIPESYFFTLNSTPTAKFSGVDPKVFDSDFLRDGVQPFVDNKSYYLSDIPLRYHGRRMLRSLSQPNMEGFAIDLNVPAILYIASPADESLPLEPTKEAPWTAHDTHESMTLLSGVDASGRALQAKTLRIHFISLRVAGGTKFKVARTAAPFVIFVEPRREDAFSCEAEEEVVSLVGGPAFAECDASSEMPDGFDCNSGLNGKHMDRRFGTWKAKGGGVGESITVRFRQPVQLTHFRFKPLDDQLLWPSQITLSYSEEGDEETETFAMRHANSLEQNTYRLRAPVISHYVKAEISQMYVNGMESGGSFEFIGRVCTTQAKAQTISFLRKILIEKCDQSLETIPEVVPLEEGMQFIAVCPHHCVVSPEGSVFGSSAFAPESTVCTSGIFAGLCSPAAESECNLLVSIGGAKTQFKKSVAHDIEALHHGPADASYTLAKAPCEPAEEERPSYFFSFGSQSAPEGWLVDDGSQRRMRNGVEYGWMRPASISSSQELPGEPLTHAGVVFPSPTNHTCQLGEDCTPNAWFLTVNENGSYNIEVLLSLPYDSQYASAPLYLEANGVPIANGNVVLKNKVFGGAATVQAKERLIALTSVCKDTTCGAESTMIISASISYAAPLPGRNADENEPESEH